MFKSLATSEGWSVPEYEEELFLSTLSKSAYVLQKDNQNLGFVTAVAYEKSGWIGNLIVPAELRGKGYGRILFEKAIQSLAERDTKSLWLTASTLGKPLYEEYGFVDIGIVERYQRAPCPAKHSVDTEPAISHIIEEDLRVWSESRAPLIDKLHKTGVQVGCVNSTALLQRHRELQVIGPWYHCGESNEDITQTIELSMSKCQPNIPLIVDLVYNKPVGELLTVRGFKLIGENQLMIKGCHDHIDLDGLVSFGSLGSMG